MSGVPDSSLTVPSPNAVGGMPAPPNLRPTYRGYISDTKDALVLFEACIQGHLQRVIRRPHDRERANLIKSGAVFIYEESASGIKRWTDGVPWSPSRIMNNFLIYRELDKPFPPGEKKRATKKAKRESRPGDPYPRPDDASGSLSPPSATSTTQPALSPLSPTSSRGLPSEKDAERSLVGSLTDSYSFKQDGLVKKTMSVKVDDVSFHLVSYYNPDEVQKGGLLRPINDPEIKNLVIRPDLLHRQNFRAPLEDEISEDLQQQPSYRVQTAPSPHYSSISSASSSYLPNPYTPGQGYTSPPQSYTSYHPAPPPPQLPSPMSMGMSSSQYEHQQHGFSYGVQQPRLPLQVHSSGAEYYSSAVPQVSTEHFSSYPDQRQQQQQQQQQQYIPRTGYPPDQMYQQQWQGGNM